MISVTVSHRLCQDDQVDQIHENLLKHLMNEEGGKLPKQYDDGFKTISDRRFFGSLSRQNSTNFVTFWKLKKGTLLRKSDESRIIWNSKGAMLLRRKKKQMLRI